MSKIDNGIYQIAISTKLNGRVNYSVDSNVSISIGEENNNKYAVFEIDNVHIFTVSGEDYKKVLFQAKNVFDENLSDKQYFLNVFKKIVSCCCYTCEPFIDGMIFISSEELKDKVVNFEEEIKKCDIKKQQDFEFGLEVAREMNEILKFY